jgi:small GTP-binding protein
MLGESGVGKTSVMQRIMTGEFDSKTTATVGVGVREISWKIDGTEQKIHLWDTAGQETYR